MAKIVKHNITYTSVPSSASMLPYDNSDSGLDATNVQDAIDEVAEGGGGGTPDLEDLGDVEITNKTAGQVIKYDGSKWVNANESGGSSTFAGLTDVSFNDLQNGQVAKYNSSTQKWENAAESGGDLSNYYTKSETDTLLDDKANVSDLPDMTDYYDKSETNTLLAGKADTSDVPQYIQDLDNVSISSATTGQVLKYNGSNWVNSNESTGSTTFAGLSDVSINSPQNGQVPKYNTTTQKWENANESTWVSSVTVTQVQSTGTKIATITVDSSATDLYAPNGGGASALNDLSDVTITSATSGQVLKYNGSDWVNANESSGGHTILDNEGDTLTQQPKLQFLGAYSENDSVNSKTKVNVVRSMTTAQFNQLSPDEKVGLINITDSGIGINELSDVDIDSGTIADGQVLVYDGTNHEWVNGTVGSASALGDLTDVDITTPTDGQALVYDSNSSEWVNGTVLTSVDADDVSFDDTSVDFSASDVQEALENIRVTLTQAEYDLLSPAEQNNGTIYYISDTNGDGQQFQPIIYSTEEREIGVWTDGKPLYEKTFTSTTNVGFNTDTLMVLDGTIPSGIEIIKTVGSIDLTLSNAHYSSSSSDWFSWYVNCNGNSIYASQSLASATPVSCITVFTLRYTKTTDTAGSGTWTPQGVPAHHYSTDEQIVGTWIDGSTLYEKTLEIPGPISNNSDYNTPHGITNLNNIVSHEGYAIYYNAYKIPIPYVRSSTYFILNAWDSTNVTLEKAGLSYSVTDVRLTIRYTKSS